MTAVGNEEITRSHEDVYVPYDVISSLDGGELLQEGDDNVDINCQTVYGKGTFHSAQEQDTDAHAKQSLTKLRVGN